MNAQSQQTPQKPAQQMLRAVSAGHVIEGYALAKGLDAVQIIDPSFRSADAVWPRHEVSYLLHQLTPLSYQQIGDATGHRDPTTVMNSLNRVKKRIQQDDVYLAAILRLEHRVRAHCHGLDVEAATGPHLARQILSGTGSPERAGSTLAVSVLSAFSVLRSDDLSDSEARRAALVILGNAGGQANG